MLTRCSSNWRILTSFFDNESSIRILYRIIISQKMGTQKCTHSTEISDWKFSPLQIGSGVWNSHAFWAYETHIMSLIVYCEIHNPRMCSPHQRCACWPNQATTLSSHSPGVSFRCCSLRNSHRAIRTSSKSLTLFRFDEDKNIHGIHSMDFPAYADLSLIKVFASSIVLTR